MTDISRTRTKTRDLTAVDLEYKSAIGAEIDLDEIDLDAISDETNFETDDIETWLKGLLRKKQMIFYGPPGTGKTFVSKHIAEEITDGTDGIYDLVQFHQSYEYEDFIQGIRPSISNDDENGDLVYTLQEGTFIEFCEEARDRNSPCILILDEINRADVSAVFGELMYLLEYRGPEHSVQLAQNTEEDDAFDIPENVYLFGTMNTADRSIALVDFALRRRFAFIPLRPNYEVLRDEYRGSGLNIESLISTLEEINGEIDDENFSLGFTYFLDIDLEDELENVWKFEIEPYLEEYFIDNPGKVREYKWGNVDIDL
ncbi:AAA domain-containing protein [Halogeometricum borinquense]|uniref:AAA domain-containing protein n=1 Tax=Halogeometricum borinquense TaxID=60847 RepID=A0A6C0UIR3_9EURY|nr:AAA family ATPase [Halogeometricum borinquense]QIB75406.1 AAA domain-containing protein [Halogeometricum borinquense]